MVFTFNPIELDIVRCAFEIRTLACCFYRDPDNFNNFDLIMKGGPKVTSFIENEINPYLKLEVSHEVLINMLRICFASDNFSSCFNKAKSTPGGYREARLLFIHLKYLICQFELNRSPL